MGIERKDLDACTTRAHLQRTLNAERVLCYHDWSDVATAGCLLGMFDPQTAEDVRSAVALIERFWGDADEVVYEGYLSVICATPQAFAFQAITHFLKEGMDGPDAERYVDRVLQLFSAEYPEHEGAAE